MPLCIFIFILYITSSVYAAPGDLDTTYGTSGIVTTSIGRFDSIAQIVLQSDDKVIAAGTTIGYTNKIALARYTTSGTLDTTTFNSGGSKPGTQTLLIGSSAKGEATTLQPDGNILVSGYALLTDTNAATARFTSSGILDTSTFNSPSGYVTSTIGGGAAAYSVITQSDMLFTSTNIVIGGAAVIGDVMFALARYDASGSLDSSFGIDGAVFTDIDLQAGINQIVLQTDRSIVAAGFVNDGVTINICLARYTPDGALDSSFGSGGIVITTISGWSVSQARSVALQTDGKIVIAGYATIAGTDNFVVARYTTAGALDNTFGTNGIVTTQVQYESQAYAVALQTDGKILAGGYSFGDEATQFALVRYTAAGALDTTFGTNGIVVTTIGGDNSDARIFSLGIQSDGKIIAAGSANTEFALARYLAA